MYKTDNLYLAFVKENPYYELSYGEMCLLKAITELFPRILEQSMLNTFKYD